MDAVDHVVLGAGAVGMAVAEALVARDESVRVVGRSGLREPVAGVQSVAGDVTDPTFAASATRGARIVCCSSRRGTETNASGISLSRP